MKNAERYRVARAFLDYVLATISVQPLNVEAHKRKIAHEMRVPLEYIEAYAQYPDLVQLLEQRILITEAILIYVLKRLSIIPLDVPQHLDLIASAADIPRRLVDEYAEHLSEVLLAESLRVAA